MIISQRGSGPSDLYHEANEKIFLRELSAMLFQNPWFFHILLVF